MDSSAATVQRLDTLADFAAAWQDTEESHRAIHERFCELVNADPQLKAHRDYIEEKLRQEYRKIEDQAETFLKMGFAPDDLVVVHRDNFSPPEVLIREHTR